MGHDVIPDGVCLLKIPYWRMGDQGSINIAETKAGSDHCRGVKESSEFWFGGERVYAQCHGDD